jgi:hypothetical protein
MQAHALLGRSLATVNRYDDGLSPKSSARRSSREPVSRRMACPDEIAGYSPAVSRSVRVIGWLRASR